MKSEAKTNGTNGANGAGTNGANGDGLGADLIYAAKAAKSVVTNLTNVLRTTTVKRTINTAYNVVRTTSWKKHLEYPVMVAVETTNKCNATCWFCPITEGSKRPPADVAELIQLGKKKN